MFDWILKLIILFLIPLNSYSNFNSMLEGPYIYIYIHIMVKIIVLHLPSHFGFGSIVGFRFYITSPPVVPNTSSSLKQLRASKDNLVLSIEKPTKRMTMANEFLISFPRSSFPYNLPHKFKSWNSSDLYIN
uniref:Uncharacterized protein n=1 Tax=Rhizophora mucronata TaxID=61149 RepID=A0A2P2KMP1_RHIMU